MFCTLGKFILTYKLKFGIIIPDTIGYNVKNLTFILNLGFALK